MEHTAATLTAMLADDFHDWIDGDDPPRLDREALKTLRINQRKSLLTVEFESGRKFLYVIEEVT